MNDEQKAPEAPEEDLTASLYFKLGSIRADDRNRYVVFMPGKALKLSAKAVLFENYPEKWVPTSQLRISEAKQLFIAKWLWDKEYNPETAGEKEGDTKYPTPF